MIHVTGNYFIQTTQYSYNVGSPGKPDKTGKPVFNTVAYCVSLKDAVRCIRDRVQREAFMSEDEISLADAFETAKQIDNDFKLLLDEAMEAIGE